MNLYLRLIWIFLASMFKPRVGFTDEVSLDLRVLPNDLDINRHQNNGRYFTLVDLVIIDLFLRSGVLKKAIRNGWRPMLGGGLITYRKQMKLFQAYRLTMQLEAWDERWNYFRFRFLNQAGEVCASGYVRGAMVSSKGRVPNEIADRAFGVHRAGSQLPDAVAHWRLAESALTSEALLSPRVSGVSADDDPAIPHPSQLTGA